MNNIIEEYRQWKSGKDTLQKAYLSGLISDDLIEKAWKKHPIGTVITRKDGQKYKKVSETGNPAQDWKVVSKDKNKPGESESKGNSEAKKVDEGSKSFSEKELKEHAKNTSETALSNAVKESPDPKVREAANEELQRREKEEKPQEEEDKIDESKKEQEKTLEEVSSEIKNLYDKSQELLNEGKFEEFNEVSKKLSEKIKLQGELAQKDKYKKGEDANKELLDKGFTQEEIDSVQSYSGKGYKTLNDSLREGKLSKDQKQEVNNINSFLEKLPSFKGKVYRGIKVGNIEEELKKWKINEDIELPAFTSTSTNKNVANSFGSFFQLELDSKKGKDLSKVSQFGADEGEILFKTDSKFKVTGISIKKLKNPITNKMFISKAIIKLKEI